MDLLNCENLSYYYPDGDNKNVILNNANISFKENTFYSIIGESGTGKTTFLSLIAGLDKPKGGNIYYLGKNINDIGLNNYRKNYVSMVFQSYNLIEYMSAYDNIVLALDISKQPYDKYQVYDLLQRFGIDKKKADRKVKHLSGGERQRIAIARAISTNTKLIIADEPTGNLDNETSSIIVSLFKELVYQYHKTVIVVTHSREVASSGDHIIRIDGNNKNLIYEK